MRRRPRTLRPDEAELWERFARSASPLGPRRSEAGPRDPAVPARPMETRPPLVLARPEATGGKVDFDLRPSVSERLATQRVDMDRKKFGRMQRGKVAPEGRIDLHGMTQAEAHRALTGFLDHVAPHGPPVWCW